MPRRRTATERELILLMCGSREIAHARATEAVELGRRSRSDVLLTLLRRLNLVSLIGGRLLEAQAPVDGSFAREVTAAIDAARHRGSIFDVITLGVLGMLEKAGIRAMPLKGSALARDLYGDPGLRTSIDIDVLVTAQDLAHAASVIAKMGWVAQERASGGLPLLHETLVHPELPRIELHWRVHWYETRFAADALSRAQRPAPGEPLRMQPADELASLLLFYQRDGFAGLRSPADVAAWWSTNHARLGAGDSIDAIAGRYPSLSAPMTVAAGVLGGLVGVPVSPPRSVGLRQRWARALANPFLDGDVSQIRANASLIDLLLAPAHGHLASVRRELDRTPVEKWTPDAAAESPVVGLVRLEHAVRMLRRWTVASARVLGR
ncbi:MAG: nucleotidyltransferase family protein [Solirubrobacteraceae bacterium]